MPRSRLWARFLLSGKSGTDAPRYEAAGSDLPPGPASRSGSQAEIFRGACCASHLTHPSTPVGGRAFPGRWARTPSGNILGPRSVPTGPFGPTTATKPRGREHRAWYPRAWSR